MRSIIVSEYRKLSTVRGPWLLLAAGPVFVVAGITGLVQSGGDVHDPAVQSKALALFAPPGGPVVIPPGLAARLAQTVLSGIEPRSPRP